MENEMLISGREFWHSPEFGELAGALALAQMEMEGASKDATNPHFRSKYADLASVWGACRAPLGKNGLAVVQMPSASGEESSLVTMLIHKSGQFFASKLVMTVVDNRPQTVGSALTYLRRYSLSAMVGVAPEDDDGNAAQGDGTKPVLKPRQTRDDLEITDNDKAIAGKPFPIEMLSYLEKIQKNRAAFPAVCTAMADKMIERGGKLGSESYDKVAESITRRWPNGISNPAHFKTVLTELWEAYQALPEHKTPFDGDGK